MPYTLDMFKKEGLGLRAIASKQVIKVPKYHVAFSHENTSVLVLDFIESKSTKTQNLRAFGKELVALHEPDDSMFGFSFDNYIGTLPQYNLPNNDWCQFFIK